MRTFLLSILLLAAASASAAYKPSIGTYADDVRARVVSKVREALADGKAVRLSGVVTLVQDGVFFLQNGKDGLKVRASGDLPSVGDEIEMSGAPTLEGGRIIFSARTWRKRGRGAVPAPRAAAVADLTDEDRGVNFLRVTVVGRAMGVTESGFALNLDDLPVNVVVSELPDFIDGCDRTHPKVSVTGVAELMLDPSALLGGEGYVMGVKVDVSGPADIVLLPDAAYFAVCHDRLVSLVTMAVIVLLIVGALVFGVVIYRQRRGMFRTRTIMAERKRMADDIHDTIEQHLVGAGMLLKINRLKEAQEVLVRAKREIRDIVWGLKNDDMMRLTPAEMLRQLAHEENVKGLYRVDTKLDGLPTTMDAAAMRDLSLIVRESIGNAVKHGGAKKIAISVDPLADGGWLMRVSNDGEPFDPETVPGSKEGHFGLEGMNQRARRIGATLRFERRGKGMVLNIERRG